MGNEPQSSLHQPGGASDQCMSRFSMYDSVKPQLPYLPVFGRSGIQEAHKVGAHLPDEFTTRANRHSTITPHLANKAGVME